MSTLGGSKGERQAKPKYAALDINRLYKNSRGESLEPSTQKNQVPRKHGMQILGKVPTSRRPPANLPSLKAETQTPGSPAQEQGGNQVGGSNSGSSVQAGNNSANSSSTVNRNSNITSQSHLTSSSSSSQLQTPPALNSSSLSANSSGTHLSSYSSNSSNFGGSNSSVTWSSVTTGHDGGSTNIPPLYQSPQFQHEFPSLDGNAPSTVAHKAHHKDSHYHHGGKDGSGGGGGAMTGSIHGGKDSQNANVGDVQQVSLRPHTDAASWIQQQSGSGKGGDSHGTQPGQVPLQAAPPQFRALMPSFMNRGAGGVLMEEPTTGSGARPTTPPVHSVLSAGGGDRGASNQGGGPDHNQQNGSYPAPAPSGRYRQPPTSQGPEATTRGPKEQRTNSPNTTSYPPNHSQKSQDERYSGRAPMPKRGPPPSIAPRFSQRPETQNSNADNSLPYIEPEDVLVQRPIIKEEDLERMDTIAKDDGWTRQDDIDYNQKLVFSDDESGESPSSASGGKRAAALRHQQQLLQQEEDNRAVWAREREHLERVEREHLERERNERNEREHRFAEMSREKADRERDWDRDRGRERERDRDKDRERVGERDRDRDSAIENRSNSASRKSGADQPRPQQNGHRGSLEPAVYERVKQRKEEEEKRELERKQAAAKKLQELEMKIGVKKSEEEVADDAAKTTSGNEEEFAARTRPFRGEKEGREGRDARDYGRYDKYERDMNQRERDPGFKDGYTSGSGARASQGAGAKGGSQFSVHFQSNLPPRFLRQQQQQERMTPQGPAPPSSSSLGGSSNRSITANHQPASRGYDHNSEVGQKSIPFAQQYDPRYVHSQNYKQQQQPQVLRRNASDEMMTNRRGMNEYSAGAALAGMGASSRRRGDSEDDDRFSSSGRESISRNSIGEQQVQPSRSGGGSGTPQLARSISDSSQRKTSVSSSDEQKLSESFQSQRSDSREFAAVGSWAEESDIEMHKQHRESVSSLDHHHSHSRYDSGSQKEEEQPQPKHILQRPQSKSITESTGSRKDDMKSDSETMRREESAAMAKSREPPTPTQILRRSESPKSWSEYSSGGAIEKSDSKADAHLAKDAATAGQLLDEAKTTITDDKKTEPAIDTNKEKSPVSAEDTLRNKDAESAGSAAKKESSDEKTDDMSGKMHGQKRPSPRGGGGRDSRGPPSRSYGMYRGGGSSWGRRGGSNMRSGDRRNYNSHLSETDNSDEFDDDYGGGHRMERSPKFPRKDSTGKQESSGGSRGGPHLSKDGFAPRGEPSRRGRGAGGSGSSSYRRGSSLSSGQKRNESYGHQNSKLGFGGGGGGTGHSSSDNKDNEKSSVSKQDHAEDKTKQSHSTQSTHSSGKKSGDSSDESKKKAQNYQSGRRDDKKSSPPKSFGNSHYQSQSLPPRRDANSGSSISKGDSPPSSKPEDDDKKDSQHISGDSSSNRQPVRDKEYPSRSNSSSHLNSGRNLHLKKDERGISKSSAPSKQSPPSIGSGGFKSQSGSNATQSGQQQTSLQSHHGKDQGAVKAKIGVDGRESRDSRDNRDNRENRENRDSRENRDARNNSKTSLPPRLAKQWETRGGGGTAKRDSNQSENSTNSQQSSSNNMSASSAWDKPLAQQQGLDSKSGEPDSLLTGQQPTGMPDGKATPNPKADGTKAGLDGSNAPVNTIIFENTNYKSATGPVKRQGSNQGMQSMQQGDQKKQDELYKSQSSSSLHDDQQGRGLAQQQSAQQQAQNPQQMQQQLSQQQQMAQQQQMHHQQQQHASQQQEAITNALSQMSFNKPESDYDKDIKLGFAFDTEFSHLTDEKNAAVAAPKAPSLGLPRSSSVIHSVVSSTSHNTISPSTVDLNMKIASVKKVWESIPSMPPVLEHGATVVAGGQDPDSHLPSNYVQSQHQQHMHHFAQTGAAAALHAATHAAGNMHVQHTLSSPGPPSYTNTFDPNLEQHFGTKESGGVVVAGGGNEVETGVYSPSPQHVNAQQQQQQNQNNVQNMSLKHSVEGNVCKVKPNQQQLHQTGLGLSPPPSMQQGTTQMHQAPQPFYQPSQFGAMPTIPSPPAVLFNSSPMPSQGGLYGPFQIEAGRSQFSQFPAHYGTAGSGPYSAYMQTPPNMPTAPGPDMYPSLTSQFRMGGTVQTPFNQSQQLNNPNTVLISSSSNSLMSASVKPSSQQIGAIGSKSNAAAVAAAASVGQPYGQQYMNLYPPQQAPPQLQSNSYYTNSAGGQGAAFFGGPQATGATQSYGLQAGIFGAHGAPPGPSNAPPQQQIANFSSQFINSPLLAATAINQFRGGPNPQNPAYMKSNQNQNHMQDSMGRQLKSPLSADVTLNLAKQVQPQQSPPHHKNYAPTWDQMMQQQQQQHQQQQSQNQQNRNSGPNNLNSGRPGPGAQRYPAPIQRPNNHPSYQQSSQPPQSQRPVRQGHSSGPGGGGGGGPMNKHYYSNSGPNRGGHSSNPNDHSMKSVNDKAIIVDNTTVNQQDMSIKDDGGNVE